MLRLCELLNQFPVKDYFARIWIVSSNDTLVKTAVTSYDTMKLLSLIWNCCISSENWKTSEIVYSLTYKGFNFSSSHLARA